jgi:hypothetical protein
MVVSSLSWDGVGTREIVEHHRRVRDSVGC